MHPTWSEAARAARPRPLALLAGVGAATVAMAWGWLCVRAYADGRNPSPRFAANSVLTRPQPDAFRAAADDHVLAAVSVLQDKSMTGTDRLESYAREAEVARGLYAASLEGCAYQPLTIARLAALRFEENPPLTENAWTDWGTTLGLAGAMAPRNATVHLSLGELLVRMGRSQDGLAAFAHALRLDPTQASRAALVLGTFGVPPEDAMAALPRSSFLLLAMRGMYEREGRLSDYANLLEPTLASLSPELLGAWADARLSSQQAGLVVQRLGALSPLPPDREAARGVHLSRAYLALGDMEAAMRWAGRARAAAPGEARALEQSANAALASGDPDTAVRFSREALTALAKKSGNPMSRARVYELSGRAEEKRGRMVAAHDAYAHAVALDPNRTTARQRLQAMRAAAGLAVPSGAP